MSNETIHDANGNPIDGHTPVDASQVTEQELLRTLVYIGCAVRLHVQGKDALGAIVTGVKDHIVPIDANSQVSADFPEIDVIYIADQQKFEQMGMKQGLEQLFGIRHYSENDAPVFTRYSLYEEEEPYLPSTIPPVNARLHSGPIVAPILPTGTLQNPGPVDQFKFEGWPHMNAHVFMPGSSLVGLANGQNVTIGSLKVGDELAPHPTDQTRYFVEDIDLLPDEPIAIPEATTPSFLLIKVRSEAMPSTPPMTPSGLNARKLIAMPSGGLPLPDSDGPLHETKQYADGSSASGAGPLPDLSPEEQAAKQRAVSAEDLDAVAAWQAARNATAARTGDADAGHPLADADKHVEAAADALNVGTEIAPPVAEYTKPTTEQADA